ncbi:olfactory receptor 2M3-like [Brachionichthys hirsutus]|uniref:olfactory receptor 2M3-like n=1 Tax=Brachionichthys hirsutus TaxID=412623 RepID=UPI00360543BD
MPLNASNASLPPPSNSHPTHIYYILRGCLYSTLGSFNVAFFTIADLVIILPLCILVLHLGLRQRRPGRAMSHCDLITLCIVVVELLNVSAICLLCYGIHADVQQVAMAGVLLYITYMSGQMLFQTLTCLERYLAVVHPIAYVKLKKGKGMRIRSIVIGCTWLLTFGGAGFTYMDNKTLTYITCYCMIALILIVISFCSLSVLCALIHPGPGDGVGGKQRVGQAKRRAFYTIMAITGVLVFRFTGCLTLTVVYAMPGKGELQRCQVWVSALWLSLPSSLLSPLLFLLRAGRLKCRKSSSDSGR